MIWLRARGPNCGIDRVIREIFAHRRIVFRQNTFLEHDAHRIFGGHDQIEERFAGARFAKRPLRDLGRRSAPVVDRDPGFLLESFVQQLKNIGLHGAVKHQPAFLLGGFDQLGVLSESGGKCSTESARL